MAISSASVGITDTTVYTSSGETAITFLSLCNYSASAVTVSLHAVQNSGSPTDSNIILDDYSIAANDTYILYHGAEKIILDNGDYINVISSAAKTGCPVFS